MGAAVGPKQSVVTRSGVSLRDSLRFSVADHPFVAGASMVPARFERSDDGLRLAIPCGNGVTITLPAISGLGKLHA